MGTITVKINARSKKAKHLLGLIEELAKTDKGVQVYNSPPPNKTTLKAMKDAEKGKVKDAKDLDELFSNL